MTQQFDQLSAATRALRLREFQKIRPLLNEETRLRQQIARLEALEAEARSASGFDPKMKSLGADLLWRGWVSRTRRQLNIDLARVLARKHASLDRLRTAFGREQAVRLLTENATASRRRKARAMSFARLLETQLVKGA